MFDFHRYLSQITQQNRLARQHHFTFHTCTGINHLDSVIEAHARQKAFIVSDDICDQSTHRRGAGYFKRRILTAYILMRTHPTDTKDQAKKLTTCREILRQIQSRLLHDSTQMARDGLIVDLSDIRSREIGGLFLADTTGLYFMIAVDEPTELVYHPEQWEAAP